MQNCKKCGAENESNSVFCVKCGRKLIKDNSGKKIYIFLGIALFLLVFFLVMFIRMLSMSQWSLTHMGKVIANGNWKCFVTHDYMEPTCEQGYVCSLCGIEEGEAIAHTWSEATCTEPKLCASCGISDGEPKGHSVRLGYCSVCHEYSKELWKEYSQIAICISNATGNVSDGIDELYYAKNFDWDIYFPLVTYEFGEAANDLWDAIVSCGSHKEFQPIRKELLTAHAECQKVSDGAEYHIEDALDAMEKVVEELVKLEE